MQLLLLLLQSSLYSHHHVIKTTYFKSAVSIITSGDVKFRFIFLFIFELNEKYVVRRRQ